VRNSLDKLNLLIHRTEVLDVLRMKEALVVVDVGRSCVQLFAISCTRCARVCTPWVWIRTKN